MCDLLEVNDIVAHVNATESPCIKIHAVRRKKLACVVAQDASLNNAENPRSQGASITGFAIEDTIAKGKGPASMVTRRVSKINLVVNSSPDAEKKSTASTRRCGEWRQRALCKVANGLYPVLVKDWGEPGRNGFKMRGR